MFACLALFGEEKSLDWKYFCDETQQTLSLSLTLHFNCRTYAANCRIKRDNSDEDLKLEIGHITLQKTEERKEFHKSKEKYHENTGALKKLKYR